MFVHLFYYFLISTLCRNLSSILAVHRYSRVYRNGYGIPRFHEKLIDENTSVLSLKYSYLTTKITSQRNTFQCQCSVMERP